MDSLDIFRFYEKARNGPGYRLNVLERSILLRYGDIGLNLGKSRQFFSRVNLSRGCRPTFHSPDAVRSSTLNDHNFVIYWNILIFFCRFVIRTKFPIKWCIHQFFFKSQFVRGVPSIVDWCPEAMQGVW